MASNEPEETEDVLIQFTDSKHAAIPLTLTELTRYLSENGLSYLNAIIVQKCEYICLAAFIMIFFTFFHPFTSRMLKNVHSLCNETFMTFPYFLFRRRHHHRLASNPLQNLLRQLLHSGRHYPKDDTRLGYSCTSCTSTAQRI